MPNLNLKDRKILYELDINARQSDAEIAKKVKLSREVVRYRIHRLQDEGIIRYFVTILNHHALGYLAFRIFFKFRDVSPEKEEEITEFLKNKVAWLVRVRGNWSFTAMVFTTTVFELEKFINDMKMRFQQNFINMHLSLITRIYHYRRGYLLKSSRDTSAYDIMGEVTEILKLDEIDFEILSVIQNNARLTSIEIAKRIGSTERIVRYRIKRLLEGKVILGFRALLDLNKLSISYFKLHFKLKNFDVAALKQIASYAHLHPNVVYKTETVGGWDLELEVQVPTTRELYAFIDKFTLEFQGMVDDYELLEYDKEYKLSYLNKI